MYFHGRVRATSCPTVIRFRPPTVRCGSAMRRMEVAIFTLAQVRFGCRSTLARRTRRMKGVPLPLLLQSALAYEMVPHAAIMVLDMWKSLNMSSIGWQSSTRARWRAENDCNAYALAKDPVIKMRSWAETRRNLSATRRASRKCILTQRNTEVDMLTARVRCEWRRRDPRSGPLFLSLRQDQ